MRPRQLRRSVKGERRYSYVPGKPRGTPKRSWRTARQQQQRIARRYKPPDHWTHKKFKMWLRRQRDNYHILNKQQRERLEAYIVPGASYPKVAKLFKLRRNWPKHSIKQAAVRLERERRKQLTQQGKADWIEGLDITAHSYFALKRLDLHTIHDTRRFMLSLFRNPSATAEYCRAFPFVRSHILSSEVLCSLAGKY
jgi:hypothetical protein